jgi:hypothetical protein
MQMRQILHHFTVWRRNFQYLRYNNYYYIYKISRRTFELSAYSVKSTEVTKPEQLQIKKNYVIVRVPYVVYRVVFILSQ